MSARRPTARRWLSFLVATAVVVVGLVGLSGPAEARLAPRTVVLRVQEAPLPGTIRAAPGTATVLRSGGDVRVVVTSSLVPGLLRLATVAAPDLDGRTQVVNESPRPVTVTVTRGGAVILRAVVEPGASLTARL